MSRTNWNAVATLQSMGSAEATSDAAADGVTVVLPSGNGSGPGTPLFVAAPGDADAARPVLCHYCKMLPGTTRDHVVPRTLFPRDQRHLLSQSANTVRACQPCNTRKGDKRVECCTSCAAAWESFGPPDWETAITVVSMIWVTKQARLLSRQ